MTGLIQHDSTMRNMLNASELYKADAVEKNNNKNKKDQIKNLLRG